KKKCCPDKLAGREKETESKQDPKVPGFSERKPARLAGRLAGRACSVLESKVAV
ncbi:hypothetical protein A2U01_0107912, partial [Trifolium medium]|nr:hypothetical protein [Trifolium medium]